MDVPHIDACLSVSLHSSLKSINISSGENFFNVLRKGGGEKAGFPQRRRRRRAGESKTSVDLSPDLAGWPPERQGDPKEGWWWVWG